MATIKLGSTGRSFLLTAAVSSQWLHYCKYGAVRWSGPHGGDAGEDVAALVSAQPGIGEHRVHQHDEIS
jgi:hypothetical protein